MEWFKMGMPVGRTLNHNKQIKFKQDNQTSETNKLTHGLNLLYILCISITYIEKDKLQFSVLVIKRITSEFVYVVISLTLTVLTQVGGEVHIISKLERHRKLPRRTQHRTKDLLQVTTFKCDYISHVPAFFLLSSYLFFLKRHLTFNSLSFITLRSRRFDSQTLYYMTGNIAC